MYEVFGVAVLFTGALLLLISQLWLTRNAWRTSRWLGVFLLVTLLLGTPLIYGLFSFRQNKRPLMLVILGVVLGALPFAADRGWEYVFGVGERERIIDGERHLTLTGWDRDDYTVLLSRKRDTAVLEMGNADVTDATLQLLTQLTQLKELTLNDTMITDASFETLKQLPALESLRLARTKITKEGVATFLADPPPKLRQIDVSGNSIPASALRKWKNADGENRRYLN